MNLWVYPGRPLQGEVRLPGDKSISHRAALFAAMAQGNSHVENFLEAGVTRVLIDNLRSLGVQLELNRAILTVKGEGYRAFQPPAQVLGCGNSGTTLRLLTGALAAAGIPAVLDGSAGLRRRPMMRIVRPLRSMGVQIETARGGTAPLRLSARAAERPLRALRYSLPVASAQVKTALLLAALAADGPTTLSEPGPSRDHSERMLAKMGVDIRVSAAGSSGQGSTCTLRPPTATLRPVELRIPGDFSSAAFLLVAALITPGSELIIRDVGLNPTRTGILEALRKMGAEIHIDRQSAQFGEPYGDLIVRHSRLRGGRVDGALVVRMIDEFPVFGVAAAYSEGRSTVLDAGELRFKESDRIATLTHELAALGARVRQSSTGFTIEGRGALDGGSVDSHGDHRLAMALAVAGLASDEPVCVRGAEMMRESFPGFLDQLRKLGAEMSMETGIDSEGSSGNGDTP